MYEKSAAQENSNLPQEEAQTLLRGLSNTLWILQEKTTGQTLNQFLKDGKASNGFTGYLSENTDDFIQPDPETKQVLAKYAHAVNAVIKNMNVLSGSTYSSFYFNKQATHNVQETGYVFLYYYLWDYRIDPDFQRRQTFDKYASVRGKQGYGQTAFFEVARDRIPFFTDMIEKNSGLDVIMRLRVLAWLVKYQVCKSDWILLLERAERYFEVHGYEDLPDLEYLVYTHKKPSCKVEFKKRA